MNLYRIKNNPYYQLIKAVKIKTVIRLRGEIKNKETYIRKKYEKEFGEKYNHDKPTTLNEKVLWLLLHYRNPLMIKLANKYTVREHIKSIGHGDLLNDIFFVAYQVDEIDFNKLPNKFVLKATHGSDMNVICLDKSNFNFKVWKKVLAKWLQIDYYKLTLEPSYMGQTPSIIAEKYIEGMVDYKLFCLNGEVAFIQLTDTYENKTYQNYYDKNWKQYNVKHGTHDNSPRELKKPKPLKKMIKIAEQISRDFPFVRVDFFYNNLHLYIGEITFFPNAGFKKYRPQSFDTQMGEKLNIDNL